MSAPPPDPDLVARAVGETLFADDHAPHFLGIELAEIGPGFARTRLTVRRELTNCHDICHGGILFALSDTSFGYACNSRNHNTVASGCSIDFIAPARIGDVLTATAREQASTGRSGIYDVEITNQHGQRVALFRGRSTRIRGVVLPHLAAEPGE